MKLLIVILASIFEYKKGIIKSLIIFFNDSKKS